MKNIKDTSLGTSEPITKFIPCMWIKWMTKELKDNSKITIADVGAGVGGLGNTIKKYYPEIIDKIELHYYDLEDNQVDSIYSKKCIGDIYDKLVTDYDVIVLSEVIEHIDPEEAIRFIEMLGSYSSNLIITTPFYQMYQYDPSEPTETHKSFWHESSFIGVSHCHHLASNGMACYWIHSNILRQVKLEYVRSSVGLNNIRTLPVNYFGLFYNGYPYKTELEVFNMLFDL